MKATSGHHHRQRLRVGAIGLAAVVLLIVLAGAIAGSVARQRPGIGRVDLAANLSAGNEAAEPLAMGIGSLTPEKKAPARR
ncbi:hypothetical protein [Sphingomonas bacterium]|uniref:hypothetical protein n=1 Tax=Sphingomonas bacterium TaxID=1895847 RepID=UPI0015768FE0|nr:hypothetical protein [Sphingomonas bacterium]